MFNGIDKDIVIRALVSDSNTIKAIQPFREVLTIAGYKVHTFIDVPDNKKRKHFFYPNADFEIMVFPYTPSSH